MTAQTYQIPLEMSWETVLRHIREENYHKTGNSGSRIRRFMRILKLLDQQETLTQLGVSASTGAPGVIRRVLELTIPVAFSVSPSEYEATIWPTISPRQARRYANNLRRMMAEMRKLEAST